MKRLIRKAQRGMVMLPQYGGGISLSDPYSVGFSDPGAARRRARISDQYYDWSHQWPYQIGAAGLYALAPFTMGLTAIPATAMTIGAAASSFDNMRRHGISVDNTSNAFFDVVDLAAGYPTSVLPSVVTRNPVVRQLTKSLLKETAEQATQEAISKIDQVYIQNKEKKKVDE